MVLFGFLPRSVEKEAREYHRKQQSRVNSGYDNVSRGWDNIARNKRVVLEKAANSKSLTTLRIKRK